MIDCYKNHYWYNYEPLKPILMWKKWISLKPDYHAIYTYNLFKNENHGHNKYSLI